jgi:hypothetical protein
VPRGGEVARGPHPRLRPGTPIDEYSLADLVKIVRWVRSDGRMRTDEEILDEVVEVMGYARRGPRIEAALRRAIERA